MMADNPDRTQQHLPYIREDLSSEHAASPDHSNNQMNITQEVQELLHHVDRFSFDELDPSRTDESNHNRRDDVPRQVHDSSPGGYSSTEEDARFALKLLREAKKEREEARRWSNDIRQAVRAWVVEQQRLLEFPIRELREELRQAKVEHQIMEESLRSLVSSQQKRLDAVEATIASQNELSNSVSTNAIGHRRSPVAKDNRSTVQPSVSFTPRSPQATPDHSPAPIKNRKPPPTVSPPSPKARRVNRNSPESQQNQPHTPLSTPISASSSSSSSSSSTSSPHALSPPPLKIVKYRNGAVRETYEDREIVLFPNGDIKTTHHSNTTKKHSVAYFYASTGVTQIETHDKLTLQFPNGQVEEHFKNGRGVMVYFPEESEATDDEDSTEQEGPSFAVTV